MSKFSPHEKAAIMEKVGQVLYGLGGPSYLTVSNMLDAGRDLRDRQLFQYPILPEAANVFQQLASSREWSISGKPGPASRAVEWFNNAASYDTSTGQRFYGFQQFEQRRALDWFTIGRTSFCVSRKTGELEYLDPSLLHFSRADALHGFNNSPSPVRPNELVWTYSTTDRVFRADEVFLDHPIPVGPSGFISPLASVIPSAKLAWLLREHDSTALDGRKIREILITGVNSLKDELEDALLQQIALATGQARPEEVGVLVVEVSNPSGQPIEKQFTFLGLSKLPENFDRAFFIDMYVNQIAAALGLSLRHFWNNEKTTNRALEEVQEQRQQQKGPNMFVRSEERLINNSKILERFGTGKSAVRFGFIEETDASSRLTDAQVLKQTAEALGQIAAVFGQSISLESYLAWMQNIRTLPAELELAEGGLPNQQIINANQTAAKPGEQIVAGNSTASAMSAPTKDLDYEQVTINQDGEIVDRRHRVFSVLKILTKQAQDEVDLLPSDEEAFRHAVKMANEENQRLVKEKLNTELLLAWKQEQLLFDHNIVLSTFEKLEGNLELDFREQNVVDYLATFESELYEIQD